MDILSCDHLLRESGRRSSANSIYRGWLCVLDSPLFVSIYVVATVTILNLSYFLFLVYLIVAFSMFHHNVYSDNSL